MSSETEEEIFSEFTKYCNQWQFIAQVSSSGSMPNVVLLSPL